MAHPAAVADHPAAPLAAALADHQELISAAVSLLVALLIAFVLDRWLARRAHRIAEAVVRGDLTPEAQTRLKFLRRLLYASIILIGVAVALSQFAGLSRLVASLLASGALAAAVFGFAARQTLANAIAGIMLAITQPVRVGDWVTFEDERGVVEDITLNFTILRAPAGPRIVIPNERLVTGVLVNDTLRAGQVAWEIDVWLPPGADVDRGLEVLEEEAGEPVTVAEGLPWGVRLSVPGASCPPSERFAREADLRARCLRRLRREGLQAGFSA